MHYIVYGKTKRFMYYFSDRVWDGKKYVSGVKKNEICIGYKKFSEFDSCHEFEEGELIDITGNPDDDVEIDSIRYSTRNAFLLFTDYEFPAEDTPASIEELKKANEQLAFHNSQDALENLAPLTSGIARSFWNKVKEILTFEW